MSTTNVLKLGIKHTQWIKDLGFYDDELDVMENRLKEVVQKNSRGETMKHVEHFQNQFIIQRNSIDELKHAIHENYEKAAFESEKNQGHIDEERVTIKNNIEDEMLYFEKNFISLKHEFYNFLSVVF